MVRIKCSHNIPSHRMGNPELMWRVTDAFREVMWKVYREHMTFSHNLDTKVTFYFKKKNACKNKDQEATPSCFFLFFFFFPPSSLPFLCHHGCHVNSWPVKCGSAGGNQQRESQCFWWCGFNFTIWWQILCLVFHECCLFSSSDQAQEMRSMIISLQSWRNWKLWAGHRNSNLETLASLIIGNIFRNRI